MTNFTPELIAKAKATKSAEELLELAKENGIELTEEEAKTCFEQLHTNGAVSDDDLDAVAGGGSLCAFFEAFFRLKTKINGNTCPNCEEKTNKFEKTVNPSLESSITPLPYDLNTKTKIEFL